MRTVEVEVKVRLVIKAFEDEEIGSMVDDLSVALQAPGALADYEVLDYEVKDSR